MCGVAGAVLTLVVVALVLQVFLKKQIIGEWSDQFSLSRLVLCAAVFQADLSPPHRPLWALASLQKMKATAFTECSLMTCLSGQNGIWCNLGLQRIFKTVFMFSFQKQKSSLNWWDSSVPLKRYKHSLLLGLFWCNCFTLDVNVSFQPLLVSQFGYDNHAVGSI